MEFLSGETVTIVFFMALLAGFVDSIAGGGGLISVPTLLSVGLSPTQALATNKLQSSFGSFTATLNYSRGGIVTVRQMIPAIGFTFIGALIGTIAVQLMDARILMNIIPFLLVSAALYFLFSPRVGDTDAQQRMSPKVFYAVMGLGIGFYDGFFGPGTGSFWSIAFVLLLGFNLLKATGHTKVVNFTSNITSLLFFALGGKVVWALGLIMGVGQILGAWLGSKMAMAWGARLVRPLVVLVSLALTVKLVYADPSNIIHRTIVGILGH